MDKKIEEHAIELGHSIACRTSANAESTCPGFSVRAESLIVLFIKNNGESSSEDLTDFCKSSGIIPHDDRAFGGVFSRMSRMGIIKTVGFAFRRKGHGTSGGRTWALCK